MAHRIRQSTPLAAALLLVLGSAAVATAQTQPPPPTPSTTSALALDTRPATTTFFGDTGLWYVPTAEVLAHRKWSVSFYRRGTDYLQGHSNVADFAATVGVGIKRVEIFGSFLVDTRIDRDADPLFSNDAARGGVIDRDPRVNSTWTGDSVGDLYVGTKVSLWSQSRGAPLALAARGMVKLATGSESAGVSTGKTDLLLDFIASRQARWAEVSGFAGYDFRGSPAGSDIPTGAFRWGVGAAFPTRSDLRVFTELNGVRPSSSTATVTTPELIGTDLSVPPIFSTTRPQTRGTIGLTYQSRMGFFLGTGLSLSLPRSAPSPGDSQSNWDWQVRLGFSPGVHKFMPPAPPPPPPPPPPPSPPPAPIATPTPHTLTVKASCDSCTVDFGKTSTVTAVANDSLGCALTYRWTAPAGTFANASQRSTLWTAPNQDRSVPVTVTATCPTDSLAASDTVSILIPAPLVKDYAFEDVYFDYDRFSLRSEATRVLDEAVDAMKQNATLNLTIQGYTCNIGTPEDNLALGTRRATVVRDYLIGRGVSADRLQMASFGEENAKFENDREATRRLNRRAALIVSLVQR